MTERRIRKASADWAQPKKQAPRPKGLAHGRWLGDFGDLSAAETELLARTADGEVCVFAVTRPAEADQSDQNSIRGELIRFLMLGGDSEHPVHEKGVQVCGGWITGQLDLREIASPFPLLLVHCHFGAALILINAELSGLYLNASMLSAIYAQGMTASGDVLLDNATTLEEVCLTGAVIAGQLSCEGACFENCDGDGTAIGHALNAQAIMVKGGVFLRGMTTLGEVRLSGAVIEGQLACNNAIFSNCDGDGTAIGHALHAEGILVKSDVFLPGMTTLGEVSLSGAVIDGQLACTDTIFSNCDADGTAIGHALNAHSMTVKGGVYLGGVTTLGEVRLSDAVIDGQLECEGTILSNCDRDSTAIGIALHAQDMTVNGGLVFKLATCTGFVDFTNASITTLIDDLEAWPKGRYFLDGFRYKRMFGNLSAPARIKWLEGQVPSQLNKDFAPQPWEQLITMYREMGHSGEAAEVAMAKQDAMRRAGRIAQRMVKEFPRSRIPKLRNRIDRMWNRVANRISLGWHWFYGKAAGYGYRPQRIVYLLFALILLSTLGFYEGRHDGLIGPTDPRIILSKETKACGNGGEAGAVHWTDPSCPIPPEYSTFQPFLYTIDVTLPLVDLHQEADWGPIVVDSKGNALWGGRLLRWLMWFDILAGWVASLMLVAIVSRLVEKD